MWQPSQLSTVENCVMDVHKMFTSITKINHKSVSQCIQHYAVGKDQTTASRKRNKEEKWRWIGHTLKKPTTNVTRQSFTWNLQGKIKRGKQRNTWQRDTEKERKKMGYTWKEMDKMATNRQEWRIMVDGLCSHRANMPK